MKKLTSILLALVLAFGVWAAVPTMPAMAANSYFPDKNFAKAISELVGKPVKELVPEDVANVKELRIEYLGIRSLSGIEYFTNLEELWCYGNNLTKLTISGLRNLKKIYCGINKLNELNLSWLNSLEVLECGDNNLTSLNLSGLNSLESLWCNDNNLTSLNLSEFNKLKELNCPANFLTKLDVSGLSKLQTLVCYKNKLTNLNVLGLTRLKLLMCHSNFLSTLNVSGLNKLRSIYCYDNNFSSPKAIIGYDSLPLLPAVDYRGVHYVEGIGSVWGNFKFSPQKKTATPTTKAAPASKTFLKTTQITLTTPAKTTLYYTTDGTKPTSKNAKTVKPGQSRQVKIWKNTTLKVYAARSGYANSDIVTREYKIKSKKPNKTAVPVSQKVSKGKITLKAPANTTLYYTTNGTTPKRASKTYVKPGKTKPITISKKTTLKVMAVKNGCSRSDVVTRVYVVK